jgi:ribose 5-phosphate isomerase A
MAANDALEDAKRAAARAAIAELPPRGAIGLGTGTTARWFIAALAEAVRAGADYVGVPTSEASAAQARDLGIPLLADAGPWDLAVCVDGADEVDPRLDLIKGGHGAHAREKIVNAAARKNVIVVDGSKLSPRIGSLRAVPVEVMAFGHATTAAHLAAFGAPALRGAGAVTAIYDLATGPIADPAALDAALHAIPGVVATGLFIGRADVVLVARDGGVERLTRGT